MEKFKLTKHLMDMTIGHQEYVVGYYVYLWYDDGVPFYIGMGRNRRAWNEHLDPAESIRNSSKLFRVQIYSHFHSKEHAHGIERQLIISFLKRGQKLCNTRKPSVNLTT